MRRRRSLRGHELTQLLLHPVLEVDGEAPHALRRVRHPFVIFGKVGGVFGKVLLPLCQPPLLRVHGLHGGLERKEKGRNMKVWVHCQ